MSESSEFVCEAVRVADVLPHPNADKLEIAVLNANTQVVVTKGEWNAGDIGVHIGPDSCVPVSSNGFSFLSKRLDYKPGSSHYRLRGARIRGSVSHGILVPVPENVLAAPGDDFSTLLGVIKYESPAERRLAEIEARPQPVKTSRFGNWLNRFTNSLVKLRRQVPEYSVASLRKLPDFFQEGEMVEITEKIHGTNVRWGVVNGRPYIGSHRVVKTDMRNWWQKLLTRKNKSAHWYGSDIWSNLINQWFPDFKDLPDNTIFYGEIYGKGIQELEYGQSNAKLVGFDIWYIDGDSGFWAGKVAREISFTTYGVPSTPVLYNGPFSWSVVKELAEQNSVLADHISEGVVVKSWDGKKRAKYVSDNYKVSK